MAQWAVTRASVSTVEIHLPPTPSPTLPRVYHVHRAVERVVYKTVGDATRPFVLQTIMMEHAGRCVDLHYALMHC